MSDKVSFPAEHLSAYDIGKRITIIGPEGAKITDELIRIVTFRKETGEVKIYLHFANVLSAKEVTHRVEYGFEVDPQQMVKRAGE